MPYTLIMVNEIKTKLTRKKNEMEELQEKLESVRKHVGSEVKKLSDLEIEINKIKTALEKIKEAGQNLNPKYLEQSQNEARIKNLYIQHLKFKHDLRI